MPYPEHCNYSDAGRGRHPYERCMSTRLVPAPVMHGMLTVRLPWDDMEGKCLATLVLGTSRVVDFSYTPCEPGLPHLIMPKRCCCIHPADSLPTTCPSSNPKPRRQQVCPITVAACMVLVKITCTVGCSGIKGCEAGDALLITHRMARLALQCQAVPCQTLTYLCRSNL